MKTPQGSAILGHLYAYTNNLLSGNFKCRGMVDEHKTEFYARHYTTQGEMGLKPATVVVFTEHYYGNLLTPEEAGTIHRNSVYNTALGDID